MRNVKHCIGRNRTNSHSNHQNAALNEKIYKSLQSLNKAETALKFGDEQVEILRRSYKVHPPDGESLETPIKEMFLVLKLKLN